MPEPITETFEHVVGAWLQSRIRHGKLSRNTIAVGLVILDRLREKCPLGRPDILSSGGEIKGSRSGLGKILQKYSIPKNFLKEATTRQAHQDGIALLEQLRYGAKLSGVRPPDRDKLLLRAIRLLQKGKRVVAASKPKGQLQPSVVTRRLDSFHFAGSKRQIRRKD